MQVRNVPPLIVGMNIIHFWLFIHQNLFFSHFKSFWHNSVQISEFMYIDFLPGTDRAFFFSAWSTKYLQGCREGHSRKLILVCFNYFKTSFDVYCIRVFCTVATRLRSVMIRSQNTGVAVLYKLILQEHGPRGCWHLYLYGKTKFIWRKVLWLKNTDWNKNPKTQDRHLEVFRWNFFKPKDSIKNDGGIFMLLGCFAPSCIGITHKLDIQ